MPLNYAKYISNTEVEFPPTNYNGISNYCECLELLVSDGYLPFVIDEEPSEPKEEIRYKVENNEVHQYCVIPDNHCHCDSRELYFTPFSVNGGVKNFLQTDRSTLNVILKKDTILSGSNKTVKLLEDVESHIPSMGETSIYTRVFFDLDSFTLNYRDGDGDTVIYSDEPPTTPANLDYWVCTKQPVKAYLYIGIRWRETNCVYLGLLGPETGDSYRDIWGLAPFNRNIKELPVINSFTNGKYLTNNGEDAQWKEIDALPEQTGHAGKVLKTNGSEANWEEMNALPDQEGQVNKFLTTDGTSASWTGFITSIPTPDTSQMELVRTFPFTAPYDCFCYISTECWNTTKILINDQEIVSHYGPHQDLSKSVDAQLILAAGDVVSVQNPRSTPSGKYCKPRSGSLSPVPEWGRIIGDINDQEDLMQALIDNKQIVIVNTLPTENVSLSLIYLLTTTNTLWLCDSLEPLTWKMISNQFTQEQSDKLINFASSYTHSDIIDTIQKGGAKIDLLPIQNKGIVNISASNTLTELGIDESRLSLSNEDRPLYPKGFLLELNTKTDNLLDGHVSFSFGDCGNPANIKFDMDSISLTVKTPIINDITPTELTHLVNKAYVDNSISTEESLRINADNELRLSINDLNNLTVKTSGNQSISGLKTFIESPIVPNPINDTQVANKAYVDSKLTSVYKYKGTVETFYDLPQNKNIGDVYNVVEDYGDIPGGSNYSWTGEAWDPLGGNVDLSSYSTTVQMNAALDFKSDKSNTYTKTEVDNELTLKANDNSVIHLDRNETILGVKTFDISPIVPNPSENGHPVTLYYFNTNITSLAQSINTLSLSSVMKTGNQTIAGVKTFSSSPKVPMPMNNEEVANKLYVDGVTTEITDTAVSLDVTTISDYTKCTNPIESLTLTGYQDITRMKTIKFIPSTELISFTFDQNYKVKMPSVFYTTRTYLLIIQYGLISIGEYKND